MTKFTMEELLGREPVNINLEEISNFLNNKVIFVSGAVGSIGSELVRQLSIFNPKTIVLFDHNENGMFFLEKELIKKFPNVKYMSYLGSVRDELRIKEIFEESNPDIVYHAAANKHVPLSEFNISEAIKTNISGTRILADTAILFGCKNFIMISTDKAVNPTSIMGATKRIAEYYIQRMAKNYTATHFNIVRFGNVLGSSGSVVPIFEAQIKEGGPVTVTDPDMTRFFMTISEASKLVIQASAFEATGEIFVLDMGDQVKIVDLAQKMINLSTDHPNDIEIIFSGIRPGEKMYEELFFDFESIQKTTHPKIFSAYTDEISNDILVDINRLEVQARYLKHKNKSWLLREDISKLIPGSELI